MGKDSYYAKLLRDPDPRKRKRFIIELGKAADSSALDELLWVYENDPLPEVRELADKARRHIKRQNALGIAPPPAPPTATPPAPEKPTYTPVLSGYTLGDAVESRPSKKSSTPGWRQALGAEGAVDKQRQQGSRGAVYRAAAATQTESPVEKIPEAARQRAHTYVNRALDASLSQDWDTCGRFLRAALDLNPSLAQDGKVLGLLSQAYGIQPDEVMRRLATHEARRSLTGEKEKAVSLYNWRETRLFLLEMGFWYVVLSLLLVFTFLQHISSFNRQLNTLAANTVLTPAESNFIRSVSATSHIWNNDANWIRSGFLYGAVLLLLITFFAGFTWLMGIRFANSTPDLWLFLRGMTRGAAGFLVLASLFWALIKALGLPPGLGPLFTAVPLVLALGVAAWYVGKEQESRLLMGFMQIGSSALVLGVLVWWFMLIYGVVAGGQNPLKALLPASDQLPATYDLASLRSQPDGLAALSALGGSSGSAPLQAQPGTAAQPYDYPWNLLPLPAGLPLPDRPLHEMLFAGQ